MAHQQPSFVAEPGEGPLHDPAPAIARWPAELVEPTAPAPLTLRNARAHALPGERLAERGAVIAAIRGHALRPLPWPSARLRDTHRGQDPRGQPQFVLLRRIQNAGERCPLLVDEQRPFCAFAFPRQADARTPLFAGAKLASR